MEGVLIKEKFDRKMNNIINKNIGILLLGRLVSLFGSSIYTFAMGIYILAETGSSMTFSLNMILVLIPSIILAPIAGVIADKKDKKKIIVLMDIMSGVVILGLYGVSMTKGIQIGYIYITTFLLSVCSVFFNTPMMAAIPCLVNKEKLTKVHSWNQAITSITEMSGPFLGGMIFALIDIRLFLLVNGISFILSGISEMFLNFNVENMLEQEIVQKVEYSNMDEEIVLEGNPFKEYWDNFMGGIRYLRQEKWLATFIAYVIAFNFLIGMGIAVPGNHILMNVIGFTPKEIGQINMSFPAAALVASLIISVLPEAKTIYRRLIFGLTTTSITIAIIGVLIIPDVFELSMNSYFVIFIAIYTMASMSLTIFNIPMNVTLQKMIPADRRGRIFGTMQTLATAAMPLAFLLSGAMMEYLPVFITPLIAGIIMLTLTISMARKKEIKEM